MQTRSIPFWLLMILVAVAHGTCALSAPATPATSGGGVVEFDRWYQVQLAGQPSGWMRALVKRYADNPRIESGMQMSITVKRGAVAINIEMTTLFVETPDGKPMRATTRQKLGAAAVFQEMVFEPSRIVTTTQQDIQKQTQVVTTTPEDRDWLPPAAAQRYIEKQLASGAKEIRYWSLDPSIGPHRFSSKIVVNGHEKVEVMGKVVPALAATVTVSAMPGVETKMSIDEQGQPIKTTVSLIPGMAMTVVETDAQLARAGVDPPELMASLLIHPGGAEGVFKNDPRRLRSAVYEVTVGEPRGNTASAPATTQPIHVDVAAFPRTGSQRVVWGDDHTARVVVDLDESNNPVNDLPTDADRRATVMLNFKDPKVKDLTDLALAGQPRDLSPAEKAEVLRRFVHHFIEAKDLSVGFATASEVARTAEGDCTEHAVLLAALLRGSGIPSRTVTGLLYVDHFLGQDGVFGYHMWTQAWVNGGWVDLDAIMDDDTPFDGAHIALATSAMADDAMFNDMVKLAPLIGRLSIRVIETSATRAGGK